MNVLRLNKNELWFIMNFMKKWYLVKTKARQEEIAVANLQNQNYIVYCPRSNINNTKVALFPGYLFIQLDESLQNLSPVRSTKGVINFVRFGLNFAKIPDAVVNFIKKNETQTIKKIHELDIFKPGDNVQITEGVLKNCIAIFETLKADDRVILLIKLMGQEQSINIDKQSIIAL